MERQPSSQHRGTQFRTTRHPCTRPNAPRISLLLLIHFTHKQSDDTSLKIGERAVRDGELNTAQARGMINSRARVHPVHVANSM